jgi:hypothetical protein
VTATGHHATGDEVVTTGGDGGAGDAASSTGTKSVAT